MTQDIDIVIDNDAALGCVDKLLASLANSDFLFDEASVRSAIETKQMFQLLDRVEILKLDLYPREMIPGELQRSVQLEIFEGQFFPVASPADAAASKLAWADKGSHKSRGDFRQIWNSASSDVQELILKLADELGLQQLLTELLDEPDDFDN
jgi:hypothetical protein